MFKQSSPNIFSRIFLTLIFVALQLFFVSAHAKGSDSDQGFAVGPQYDTTHIYLAPSDVKAFTNSFVATFGGSATKVETFSILPVPNSTQLGYILAPVGTIVFYSYQTPIPYPFGQEHYGYMVTNVDQAVKAARKAGAELIMEFPNPRGHDAIVQWSGGVKIQLYSHFVPPSYAALETIPEGRIYISRDRVDEFVRSFTQFSHGKIVEDKQVSGAEVGQSNTMIRRILIDSPFEKMRVMVTDGRLPYPFGYDVTGYEVKNIADTLTKAKAAGVKILSGPYRVDNRTTAILQFPGGYVAEVHQSTIKG